MNPRTRKTLVYLSLVAAVIYALLNMKQEFDAGAEAPVASEIPQPKGAVKPAAAPIDIAKYDVLEWGRDPFRKEFSAPAEASNPTPPGWILNGILYDENEPSAIIDGRVVRTGSDIRGARVIRIDKNKVTLDIKGSRLELTLSKEKT